MQMLTMADKGGRGVMATNDITDKMTKKYHTYGFFLKLIFIF